MEENEREKKEKEMSGNLTDSDRKTMDLVSARRQSISAGMLTELDKALQDKKQSEITGQRQQYYSGHDGNHNQEHHQGAQHQQIYDFTGSLKDELSVAAIGMGNNETVHPALFVIFHLSSIFIFYVLFVFDYMNVPFLLFVHYNYYPRNAFHIYEIMK